jgi:hypothetical protein
MIKRIKIVHQSLTELGLWEKINQNNLSKYPRTLTEWRGWKGKVTIRLKISYVGGRYK